MESVENVGEFVLWVEVGVLLLGVLGVLWAPLAAAICALVARSRKLATGSYAAAGAKHSALFILPWLYQLVRMCDRTVPRFVVGAVYGLLYATWALAFLGGQGVALVILVADVNNAEMHLPLAGMVIWIALYVVLLPLSALTWGWSARRLWKRATPGGGSTQLPLSVMPDGPYLEPFYWLFGWTVVFFFLLLLTTIFYFSNS